MRIYKVLGLSLAALLLTPMAASARINHYYEHQPRGYYEPGHHGKHYRHGHDRHGRHGRHEHRDYYPVRERVVYYEPMPRRRITRPVYYAPPVNYYYGPQPGLNLNVNFR